MPPWMFCSPFGPVANRRLLVLAAVCLLAAPIFFLSAPALFHLATAHVPETDDVFDADQMPPSEAAVFLSRAARFVNLRCLLVLTTFGRFPRCTQPHGEDLHRRAPPKRVRAGL